MSRFLLALSLAALGCAADADEDATAEGGNSVLGGGSEADDADDDGDGFTNAEEAEAGTNPDYEYSRPYTGGYNVGFCDTPPDPTGPTGTATNANGVSYTAYTEGDVANNFTMIDQHGEQVDLYSFCGKTVMIALSAGWCGPCRSLAATMQTMQDDYRDQDLQIIEIITADNSYNEPNVDFLAGWAHQYEFEDIPVLLGPTPTSWTDELMLWELDGYIPTVFIVGPDGTILSADNDAHDPGSFLQ